MVGACVKYGGGGNLRTFLFLVESYLTPGSRIMVQNLIVSQPEKKSPAFYVTRTIINLLAPDFFFKF